MPKRPNTPCKHPGCPKLVAYGNKYCDEHKALHTEEVRSAYTRGYNRSWQKASKAFLNTHPLCEKCKVEGRYTKATVVDTSFLTEVTESYFGIGRTGRHSVSIVMMLRL